MRPAQASKQQHARAQVFDDLEDYEAAIADFSQALEKRFANQFRAHFHRGICYRAPGRHRHGVFVCAPGVLGV